MHKTTPVQSLKDKNQEKLERLVKELMAIQGEKGEVFAFVLQASTFQSTM